MKNPSNKELPKLLGVLNVTPDSFSDGGNFVETEKALVQFRKLLAEGADFVDVGAVSTGPGSKMISGNQELARLKPLFDLLDEDEKVKISLDTYCYSTAAFAFEQGVRLLNDVSAFRHSPRLAELVAGVGAKVVLMYSKELGENPHVTNRGRASGDIVENIIRFLSERLDFALNKGIEKENIILDPGFGQFLSPNPDDSWEVLGRLSEICCYFGSISVLVGVSRKGFLGGEVSKRDGLSQHLGVRAWQNGAQYIRTHNVKMAKTFLEAEQELFDRAQKL